MSSARLRLARRVTRKHGAIFAEAWEQRSCESGSLAEAFDDTGLIAWPDDRDAQGRYHDLEEEITERTFAAVRDAIAEAFVQAATDVLTRERERPQDG